MADSDFFSGFLGPPESRGYLIGFLGKSVASHVIARLHFSSRTSFFFFSSISCRSPFHEHEGDSVGFPLPSVADGLSRVFTSPELTLVSYFRPR